MIKRIDIPYYDKTENVWKLKLNDTEYQGKLNYIINIFIDNKHVYKYKINDDIKEAESFEDVLAEVINNYKDITFDSFEDCYSEQEIDKLKCLVDKLTEKEKSEPVLVEEWTYMYEYEVIRLLRKSIKEHQREEDIKAYKAKRTYDKVLLTFVFLMLIDLALLMLSVNLLGKELIVSCMGVYVIGCIATMGINQMLYMLWYGKPYRKFLDKNKIVIITSRDNGVR